MFSGWIVADLRVGRSQFTHLSRGGPTGGARQVKKRAAGWSRRVGSYPTPCPTTSFYQRADNRVSVARTMAKIFRRSPSERCGQTARKSPSVGGFSGKLSDKEL